MTTLFDTERGGELLSADAHTTTGFSDHEVFVRARDFLATREWFGNGQLQNRDGVRSRCVGMAINYGVTGRFAVWQADSRFYALFCEVNDIPHGDALPCAAMIEWNNEEVVGGKDAVVAALDRVVEATAEPASESARELVVA